MKDKKKRVSPACAACTIDIPQRACMLEKGKAVKGCPTLIQKEVLAEANKEYEIEKIQNFANKASLQEAECYVNRDQIPYIMQPSKTRIVETCEFAMKMEYKKIGLAFCLGLSREAKVVEQIIKAYGFDVVSICCKAGRSPKEMIGLTDDEKVFKGTDESMCNPIFQAKTLNSEDVDFNVLLGLCVGHDTLFFQYSNIPTTVLAVKDRVTCHNPLAPIYNSESYYKKIQFPDIES